MRILLFRKQDKGPAKTMRNKTGRVFLSALLSLCAALLATSAWAQDKVTPAEAKKIAREAYIFSYPLVVYYGNMYMGALDLSTSNIPSAHLGIRSGLFVHPDHHRIGRTR